MFGVIGLGNPGKQYAETRHNVGFRVTELLAGSASWKTHGSCRISRVSIASHVEAHLIQPQQFMNRSGQSARPVIDFFRIELDQLIVVYDELDLEPGTIRIRKGGSSGGHKGLDDLLRHLGSGEFFRIRVGIGHPRRRAPEEVESRQDVATYVLGAPRGEEKKLFDASIERAAEAVIALARDGLLEAQQRFHPGTDKAPQK